MTTIELYDLGTSTTLESNKSLVRMLAGCVGASQYGTLSIALDIALEPVGRLHRIVASAYGICQTQLSEVVARFAPLSSPSRPTSVAITSGPTRCHGICARLLTAAVGTGPGTPRRGAAAVACVGSGAVVSATGRRRLVDVPRAVPVWSRCFAVLLCWVPT